MNQNQQDNQPPPPPPPPMTRDQKTDLGHFRKNVPHYYHDGQSFDGFLDLFFLESNNFRDVPEFYLKIVLYSSLRGQASSLAVPTHNPTRFLDLTLREYANKLMSLFQPEAETEQTKLAFIERHQKQGEHALIYFQAKRTLFLRAYNENTRDYNFFYDRVIEGLTNLEMRKYLSLNLPEPMNDTDKFMNAILKVATAVRKSYLRGEISDADCLGAEAFDPEESSDGMPKQTRTTNMIAAVGDKSKNGLCYYCRSKDHFIAQCPRKAAGLPSVVQSVPNNSYKKRVRFAASSNTFPARTTKTYPQKFSQKATTRFQKFKNQKGRQGRIMLVYEDENGELECTDIEEEQEVAEADNASPPVEGINELRLQDDDHDESDFVPGAFLGLGQS